MSKMNLNIQGFHLEAVEPFCWEVIIGASLSVLDSFEGLYRISTTGMVSTLIIVDFGKYVRTLYLRFHLNGDKTRNSFLGKKGHISYQLKNKEGGYLKGPWEKQDA